MAVRPVNLLSFSLFFITITQISIQSSDSAASLYYSQTTTTSDSSFSDPVVWDSSSLYKRNPGEPTTRSRTKRSASPVVSSTNQPFVDACQSKMEVLTPYYATNSKGKVRTVVNSELMQQAIQVETCVR